MSALGISVGCGLGLGLLLGSFLNVCISRLPRGESVVRPGSRCEGCGAAVRWYDNVPVVSWMALRGRCRDCGERISWRYPVVELAMGVWLAAAMGGLWTAWVVPGFIGTSRDLSQGAILSLDVLGFGVLGFLLIGLIVMDWQTQLLPDAFTWTGIAAGLFLVCSQAIFLGPGEDAIKLNPQHGLRMSSPGSMASQGNVFLTGPEALIGARIMAVLGAAGILLLIRWGYKALRGREGMGLGDVKMLGMIAAFLGFWPAMVALFAGVLAAAVYGVVLLAGRRAGGATRLPLGSFLGVGGLVAAVVGRQVVRWYGGLL